MNSLERFKRAQEQSVDGFDTALREIQSGRKQTHWIWYVFPQLRGLGLSEPARVYGIDGVAEAVEYLRDAVLRSRLTTIALAVGERLRADRTLALATLMGSGIDVTKIVSSLTLFEAVATRLHIEERVDDYARLRDTAREILAVAREQGYPPCNWTRGRLDTAGFAVESIDGMAAGGQPERSSPADTPPAGINAKIADS